MPEFPLDTAKWHGDITHVRKLAALTHLLPEHTPGTGLPKPRCDRPTGGGLRSDPQGLARIGGQQSRAVQDPVSPIGDVHIGLALDTVEIGHLLDDLADLDPLVLRQQLN